jgi:hypothetical protein
MTDKFWNLAIRELYYIGFIPKDDMISIYGSYNNDLINEYEDRKYYLLVIANIQVQYKKDKNNEKIIIYFFFVVIIQQRKC